MCHIRLLINFITKKEKEFFPSLFYALLLFFLLISTKLSLLNRSINSKKKAKEKTNMGWLEVDYNEGIKRKDFCDALFTDGLNTGWYKVKKSAMVGSTYYAAITKLKRYKTNDCEAVEEIPSDERRTYGVVVLTSKSNSRIAYKIIDETMGPSYYACPKSILKILDDIDSVYANNWRNKCLEYHKRNNDLNKLPVGTRITFPALDGKVLVKSEPLGQFKRPFWRVEGEYKYWKKKNIDKNFKVLEEVSAI